MTVFRGNAGEGRGGEVPDPPPPLLLPGASKVWVNQPPKKSLGQIARKKFMDFKSAENFVFSWFCSTKPTLNVLGGICKSQPVTPKEPVPPGWGGGRTPFGPRAAQGPDSDLVGIENQTVEKCIFLTFWVDGKWSKDVRNQNFPDVDLLSLKNAQFPCPFSCVFFIECSGTAEFVFFVIISLPPCDKCTFPELKESLTFLFGV